MRMAGMPLAHVSWAIADNKERKPCDQWLIDIFGAEPVYEMLMTPEAEKMGLDREETLMMIGDTMVIPIAPAASGPAVNSPTGDMLRRSAGSMRWLGLALKVADLRAAAAWFEAKGFKLHYDPGMAEIYFLVGRKQALGVRLEILATDLPNDPRQKPGWNPMRWRDEHPLGIEGLQSVIVSAPSIEALAHGSNFANWDSANCRERTPNVSPLILATPLSRRWCPTKRTLSLAGMSAKFRAFTA
jgi:hypothetical protein